MQIHSPASPASNRGGSPRIPSTQNSLNPWNVVNRRSHRRPARISSGGLCSRFNIPPLAVHCEFILIRTEILGMYLIVFHHGASPPFQRNQLLQKFTNNYIFWNSHIFIIFAISKRFRAIFTALKA